MVDTSCREDEERSEWKDGCGRVEEACTEREESSACVQLARALLMSSRHDRVGISHYVQRLRVCVYQIRMDLSANSTHLYTRSYVGYRSGTSSSEVLAS